MFNLVNENTSLSNVNNKFQNHFIFFVTLRWCISLQLSHMLCFSFCLSVESHFQMQVKASFTI